MTPKLFIAVYQCEECDEEYELENCYLEFISIPCEECGVIRRFYAQKLIHKSWEWDTMES